MFRFVNRDKNYFCFWCYTSIYIVITSGCYSCYMCTMCIARHIVFYSCNLFWSRINNSIAIRRVRGGKQIVLIPYTSNAIFSVSIFKIRMCEIKSAIYYSYNSSFPLIRVGKSVSDKCRVYICIYSHRIHHHSDFCARIDIHYCTVPSESSELFHWDNSRIDSTSTSIKSHSVFFI